MPDSDPKLDPFPRGAVDTIQNKLSYFSRFYNQDMQKVQDAMNNSFTHVLRLPRVNTRACVEKYGGYFDKLEAYHNFVKDTSFELVGYIPEHPFDSYYFYKSQADAEKMAKVMVFRQENVELPLPVQGKGK